ncbi:transglycosylase domain-containing protein [Alteribacillus sp. HJP-4]|uniref:transglycosylase domain-containing protein n=1 Tax=Alteribacillus sp. HJP-4 TaxID=2775394 RepID=UPI0035CCD6A1
MNRFFEKLNHKYDAFRNKPVVQGINVTSQVMWNILLIFIVLILMFILFAGSVGAGFFMSLTEDQERLSKEELEQNIYDYEEVSDIYFAEEKHLGKIPADLERKERSLDEISDHLINAVISTEDEYFYDHNGVVPKALMRATYQELAASSNQTGGSTLTQQVVKNQILTNEVSFERKAKEITLALRMENYFEKEEILEAYLNIVPFGRNANGRNIAGAQSAAEGIFGMDASELNIAQSAFIAGLPKNPFTYSPFAGGGEVKDDFQQGLNRMKLVLGNMHEEGYISETEYEEALDYNIRENLTERAPTVTEDYPFLTYETQGRASRIIRDQMLEEDGIELDELDEEEQEEVNEQYTLAARNELALGGYNVHLTVNKDIYNSMQQSVADSQWFGPDREDENGETQQEQVGSIMIDNSTGAIISFTGGRDFDQENLNHATQAFRQNGSTMKPLLAYGPAMDEGLIQPGTIVPDVPTDYNGGDEINNFDRSHKGFISVRKSLQESRNVPAVRAADMVDHDKARNTLLDMGLTSLHEGEPFQSTALGGLSYGATIEQNTNAFSLFGNDGELSDSYMIEKIETKEGEVVYEHEVEPKEIFSPQTSFLMTDMMKDVLQSGGTASSLPGKLNFGGDWAGKTGTTTNTKDSWFVGLNPNVTFGLWIGYDDPQEISTPYKGLTYGARTQQIWADLMNASYEADPDVFGMDDEFEQPDGIVRQTICGISGKLPSDLCEEADLTTTDYFNEEFLPTEKDDSLSRERYVTIDDERYTAYDSTPSEFTRNGVSIDEDYFDVSDVSEYLPDDWEEIVPDREAPSNGRSPSRVSNVRYQGGKLRWSQHSDNDIVGYRIYNQSGSQVGTVRDNDSTSYDQSGGSLYVTAVDTRGRESSPSSTAQRGSGGSDRDNDSSDEDTSNEEDSREPEEEQDNDDSTNDSDSSPEEDESSPEEDESNNGGDNNGNGNENNDRNGNGNGSGSDNDDDGDNGNGSDNGNNDDENNGGSDDGREEEEPDEDEGSSDGDDSDDGGSDDSDDSGDEESDSSSSSTDSGDSGDSGDSDEESEDSSDDETSDDSDDDSSDDE